MTDTRVLNLLELRRHSAPGASPPWHLTLIQPEINGGKVSLDELKRLADSPTATALTISGLEQKSLEFLCEHVGAPFTAIHFWKCPRIEDLSALEAMPQLTHVAFYWNQRATRLWNLARTPRLRGLHFDDFTKLQDLSDLPGATSLEELAFGNAVWNRFGIPSLEPLAELVSLRSLAFNAKSVLDGRIQPLAKLVRLDELDVPSGLFTTIQLAWLRAHLPRSVSSTALEPFRRLRQPLTRKGKQLDVLVSGKRKPFLSTQSDSARLDRYVAEFNRLVERFSNEPDLEPESLAAP